MKRLRILRIMLEAFITYLNKEMSPSGKTALHDLSARANLVIDALPHDSSVPELSELETLDNASVKAGLNRILTALRIAHHDDWTPVAIETLRLVMNQHIDEISKLSQPQLEEKK